MELFYLNWKLCFAFSLGSKIRCWEFGKWLYEKERGASGSEMSFKLRN